MLSQESARHRNFTEHNFKWALAHWHAAFFCWVMLKCTFVRKSTTRRSNFMTTKRSRTSWSQKSHTDLAQEASRLVKLLHVFAVFNLLALESAHLWWCLVDWNVVLGCGILQGCSVIENHKATEGPSQWLNAVEDVKVLLASMQNMLQLSNYPSYLWKLSTRYGSPVVRSDFSNVLAFCWVLVFLLILTCHSSVSSCASWHLWLIRHNLP